VSEKLVIACVQARAHDRDAFPARFPELLTLIERAAEQAELVVAPEGTVPAYCIGKEAIDPKQIAQAEDAIKAIARRRRATIVYGTARVQGERTFNSAVVIGPDGSRLGHVDKRFLWHFDRRWFAPGSPLPPIPTPVGRLGVLICADGRIPAIAASLADEGAEILVVPTAWVTSGRNPATLENIQADLFASVRARENGVPLVAANKVGVEQHSVLYCGKSQIVDADGAVLARASEREECIITAEIAVGASRPRASATILRVSPNDPAQGVRTAVRIALSHASDPREICELAHHADVADAELLVVRGQPRASTSIPFLTVASIEPDHASLARIGDLSVGIVGSRTFCNPHALVQARLAGVDLFLWPGLEDAQEGLAFTRTRAMELRACVITVTPERATACDPDGVVVCGTFDDYRVAAFTHDRARCAQTEVAPHTDVLAGLRAATTFMLLFFALFFFPHPAWADGLPDRIAPPEPFPKILSQTFEQESVTLGLRYGRYYLMTAAGPLVVHTLIVNPREPTLRLDAAIASDRLISKGEAVSSMAHRTGAVAGINGDFFDIGNTYQPIGIVIRAGALVRSPSMRAVMTIAKTHDVRFETFRFGGTIADEDGRTWNLSTLDEWPPHDGVSLLTPALGSLSAQPGVMLALLTPLDAKHYRVAAINDIDAPRAALASSALGFGPAAMSKNGIPSVGDILSIAYDTDPPLDEVAAAIGGGPLLLRDGVPYDDPYPPAPREALRRVPLTGALRQSDGTLVLLEVDGRAPHVSVGLTRSEFTALLRGLGGVDGMAFDGGGSATLVARAIGDAEASVRNKPSDGRERPVADGLFVYSDAPIGPPARLAVRHGALRIMKGASASLDLVVLDAAGHVLDIPTIPERASVTPDTLARVVSADRVVAGNTANDGVVHVKRKLVSSDQDGTIFTADIPLQVVDRIATLRIEPEYPNPRPGERIALRVVALNASGAPIGTDGRVAWKASGGSVSSDGMYVASSYDGTVIARVDKTETREIVRVGSRVLPIDVFRHDGPAAHAWHFASSPADQPGGAEIDEDDALSLSYDFTGSERVAYANTDVALDGDLLALSVDVQGDANGAALRVALTNPDGDRIPVTLARHVDWQGWKTLTINVPRDLIAARTLHGFYLADTSKDDAAAAASSGTGTIVLRNLRGIFAGTSMRVPPYHTQQR
jgi:predicted amidohydrolase/exopolysaccharide biosynthesis protein